MFKSIPDFLKIQKYIFYSDRINEQGELILRVGRPNNGDYCPKCGSKKLHVHSHGTWQKKKHSNFQKNQIYLEIRKKRFKCVSCKKVFSQQLPGIPKYARKTNNFEEQSLDYLATNSFNETGKVNKTSYSTLKKQLYKYINPHKLSIKKLELLNSQSEIYLGVDGQSFRGLEMVLTITEVKLRETITVLPSENKLELESFLREWPKELRLKVKGISIDMTNKQKKTLEKYFPNALIVVDHYHLIQHAVRLMQKTRTSIQNVNHIPLPIKKEMNKNIERLENKEKQKLIKHFLFYPELKQAYFFKERVRSLYRISKRKKAAQKLKILKRELLASNNSYMKDLAKTLNNWEFEILNYFTCGITNAYTEGIHTKCKLIKRKSYGFRNVQTYVRKLILGLFPLIFILSSHTF